MKVSNSRFGFRMVPMLLGLAAVLFIGTWLYAADQTPSTSPAASTSPATSVAPEPPPAAPDATKETPGLNAWDLYKKGGFFMYPLTLCSVLAIAIIIERFVALRRSIVVPPEFLPGLQAAWRDPVSDRQAALAYCGRFDAAIARMIAAGIKRIPRGFVQAEKAVEDAGANEAIKLRRNMRFLYALGSVATLLGLIGTISGMIKAFQNAAGSSTGHADIQLLTTGIYEAMVNTFGGLAVAIVVTVFYYFFIGRIEKLITELNDTLSTFTDEFGFNAESDRELRATRTL